MPINRWLDKDDVVYTYNGILLSHKKTNEILPFVTTWMGFECVMLSEMSYRERQILYDISCICGI